MMKFLTFPRTHRCFELIENDDKLDYDLPRKGAVAGQILNHCYTVLDAYLQKWQTHDVLKLATHIAHIFGFTIQSLATVLPLTNGNVWLLYMRPRKQYRHRLWKQQWLRNSNATCSRGLSLKFFYVCVQNLGIHQHELMCYIYMRLHLHAHVQSKAYQDAKKPTCWWSNSQAIRSGRRTFFSVFCVSLLIKTC